MSGVVTIQRQALIVTAVSVRLCWQFIWQKSQLVNLIHPQLLLLLLLHNIDNWILLRLLFCFVLSAIFWEGVGIWLWNVWMFVCHWWNGTSQLGVYTIVLFWCNQFRRNCLMIHDVVSAGPTAGRVASQQRGKREYLIELHQFPLASCLFCVCVCVSFLSLVELLATRTFYLS